jgi:hypothetical protein
MCAYLSYLGIIVISSPPLTHIMSIMSEFHNVGQPFGRSNACYYSQLEDSTHVHSQHEKDDSSWNESSDSCCCCMEGHYYATTTTAVCCVMMAMVVVVVISGKELHQREKEEDPVWDATLLQLCY